MELITGILKKKLSVQVWPKGMCQLPKRSLVEVIKVRQESGIAIIGEVRNLAPTYSNPSKWSVNNLIDIYQRYLSAISIFTDDIRFGGCLDWLSLAKEKSSLPILALDFIVCKEQLCCLSSYGADAVVLIAKIVSSRNLIELSAFAKKLNLEVVVEIQDEKELSIALESKADIIGINTRSLENLKEVNIEKPYSLRKLIPDNVPIIVESGINYPHDLWRFHKMFNAVMIGSAFVESEDIESKVRSFMLPSSSSFYPFIWVKPAAYLDINGRIAYDFLIENLLALGFRIRERIVANKAPEIAYALYKHKLIKYPKEGLFWYHVVAAYYDFISRQGDNCRSEIIFLEKKKSLMEDMRRLSQLKIFFRNKIDNTLFIHDYLGQSVKIKMHSFHVSDIDLESCKHDLSILMKYPCLNLSINDYMTKRMYLFEDWYRKMILNEEV